MSAHLTLLERALAKLRATLTVEVECNSDLRQAEGDDEYAPVPGTYAEDLGTHALEEASETIQLIRDIEAVTGRFTEHPEPQWLDDLIDGKWSLS